jgi:hypothetical protein
LVHEWKRSLELKVLAWRHERWGGVDGSHTGRESEGEPQ